MYVCMYVCMHRRACAVLTQQPGHLQNSAVGFSGVLFAYVLIDSFHSQVARLRAGWIRCSTCMYVCMYVCR